MDARDELKSYLISALNQETIYPHEAEEAAEKLINDLLHEAAKKIRNELSYAYGCRQAADLIDPYV